MTLEANLSFRIDADYNKVIPDETEKYRLLDSMRDQMIRILDCESRNIKNMTVRSGSIIVSFDLESYDESEDSRLKMSHHHMIKMIQDGKLKLVDADGNVMPVPPQTVNTGGPHIKPPSIVIKNWVPFVALGIGLTTFMFVIICLTISICIKRKKRLEKISPLAVVRLFLFHSHTRRSITSSYLFV